MTIKGLQGFAQNDIAAIFEEAVGAAPVEVKIVENPNRTRGLSFITFDTPELARAVRHTHTKRRREGRGEREREIGGHAVGSGWGGRGK